jgi:hypothetical protein
MTKWFAVLSDGNAFEGGVDDGSWRKLKLTIDGRRIERLHIFNDQAAGRIDDNKDGYFIGNKIIGGLGQSITIHLCGIGYYQKHDNIVRIKWYDKQTMELQQTEARPAEECGFSLITCQ